MEKITGIVDQEAGAVESSDLPFPARALETLGDFVDGVVALDRMGSAIASYKTEMIDQARRWSELAENQQSLMPDGSRDPVAWSPEVVARRSVATELACALRIPERTAENMVEESRTLVHELPATLTALRSGDITARHAGVIVSQAWSLPEDARSDFEKAVLPAARRLTVSKLKRRARVVRERTHPDSITVRHDEATAHRGVFLDAAADGMTWLSALLPAAAGEGIYNRLTDIATSLKGKDEARGVGQLRADVFSDLLLDGSTDSLDPRTAGIRPAVAVTVPALSLLGQSDEPATLDGYGPIDIDTARDLAARAPSFTRILTHPETGVVLSVGRNSYTVPADLRRWLRLRDRICRFPGCNKPARDSDVDHTLDWQYQGETEEGNLAHLCENSHNLKHHTRWKARQVGDGVLDWTSPAGKHYRTEPELRMRPAFTDGPPGDQPTGDQSASCEPPPF